MARRIAALAPLIAAAALAAAVPVRAAPSETLTVPPGPPMTLVVDARDAPRNILHVRLTVPVQAAGPLTLVYPKWVPGWHGPTGPIQNAAAIRMQADGSDLRWQRDLVDMYAFHVTVPTGVSSIDVAWDQLMTSDDRTSTPNLLNVEWNRVVMYPQGREADDVGVRASIILPSGWDYGTALPNPQRSGDRVDFDETSLTTLVDSPLDAGSFSKHISLLDAGGYTNQIDIFADEPEDLAMTADQQRDFVNLIGETDAMYGARHWQHYHFLLLLSDTIPGDGIEHHQSSDNRADAAYLTDPDDFENQADLMPHEFSHSWNGKYRRPFDLLTPDYQAPEETDLLWVYEGLNQYLGQILVYRSGLEDPAKYPELLASLYAGLDYEPGRLADPLVDTAIAAPYLYQAPHDWPSQRRSTGDFYGEGELIWLSVDAVIRTQTHGAKSLDDFLKAYAGPPSTGPMAAPYTREDIEGMLNVVCPYDWHGFFQRWIYDVAPHPISMGITLSGWKLVWSSTPNRADYLQESDERIADFTYSLGFNVTDDGKVTDVLEGSPAARAGVGTDIQIIGVDGRKFSPDVLSTEVGNASSSSTPIDLLVESADRIETIAVDYHGGLRFPHLERVPGTDDLLATITAPHRSP